MTIETNSPDYKKLLKSYSKLADDYHFLEEAHQKLEEEYHQAVKTIHEYEAEIEQLKLEVTALKSIDPESKSELETAKEAEYLKKIDDLNFKVSELQRLKFGRKSERVPSIKQELGIKADPEKTAEIRAQKREERYEQMEKVTEFHPISEENRVCPNCSCSEFRTLGVGKGSTVIDYVPGHFVKKTHVRETLACTKCDAVITAPVVEKPYEKGRYSATFMAHVVTAKCMDSIPIHRYAHILRRAGVDISVSTLTDLFHRCAETLEPLGNLILAEIAASDIVQADETPLQVLNMKDHDKGWVWVFLNEALIAYRFVMSRSGETPLTILNGNTGTLVVDGYSGYNAITKPDGMTRVGCNSHARRKFHNVLKDCSEAQTAIDFYRDVYVVEHEAYEAGVSRTDKHLEMRQERSLPIMESFKNWLDEQRDAHEPGSPMAKAVNYSYENWPELTRFLYDARIPVDNNASERALRKVALGRNNWLFAGSKNGGLNFATLMTLVASCEKNGINPEQYLADVLIRIHKTAPEDYPGLLPHRWKPPETVPKAKAIA